MRAFLSTLSEVEFKILYWFNALCSLLAMLGSGSCLFVSFMSSLYATFFEECET